MATVETIFLIVFIFGHHGNGAPIEDQKKLVVFMVDGFRHDYISRMLETDLPTFNRIIKDGVQADYVQSIFPSVSFPSWTTIATGLYADIHGVTGNNMIDPNTNATFALFQVGTENDTTNATEWYDEHIPVWISAKQKGLGVSMYHWGRCDVPFVLDGVAYLPDFCTPYNNHDPMNITFLHEHFNKTIRDVKHGVDLIMVYYSGVDEMGHRHGPDSEEVLSEVRLVDVAVGKFLEGLGDAREDVNFIVLTDHGMTNEWKKPQKKITDFVDPEAIEKIVGSGAFAQIKAKDGLVEKVYSDLHDWQDGLVYKREDIPDHYHFRDHDQVLDILVDTQGNSFISPVDPNNAELYWPPTMGTEGEYKGGHGYDDTSPDATGYSEGPFADMRGIFLAMGPYFKIGHSHPWIKLVDEYQIFLEVLDLEGERHNGTWWRVRDMFRSAAIARTTRVRVHSGVGTIRSGTATVFITAAMALCFRAF